VENKKLNKPINLNISLELDMDNEIPIISHIEIKKSPEQMTYKEKVIAYFENDVATRLDKWNNYKTWSEIDASTPLLIQKRLAEEQYLQAKQTLEVIKLL
jgi:hypothetical protein